MDINETVDKYANEAITRFRVGDQVKIVRKDTPFHGKKGVVTKIDGEYHIVKVKMGSKTPKGEFYRHEIEKV